MTLEVWFDPSSTVKAFLRVVGISWGPALFMVVVVWFDPFLVVTRLSWEYVAFPEVHLYDLGGRLTQFLHQEHEKTTTRRSYVFLAFPEVHLYDPVVVWPLCTTNMNEKSTHVVRKNFQYFQRQRYDPGDNLIFILHRDLIKKYTH